jgi:hypothetical protein
MHSAPEVSQSSSVKQSPANFPYVGDAVKSVVHILLSFLHHPLLGSHPEVGNFDQLQAPLYIISLSTGSSSSWSSSGEGLGEGDGAGLGEGDGAGLGKKGDGVKPDVFFTNKNNKQTKAIKATARGFFIYISLLFLFRTRLRLFATRSSPFSCGFLNAAI